MMKSYTKKKKKKKCQKCQKFHCIKRYDLLKDPDNSPLHSKQIGFLTT